MIVDAYAHDVPPDFYEEMGRVHPTDAHAHHPEIGGFFDYDRRLRHLDEYGIDRQVIALGGPHFWRGIDLEDALPLVERANDEIRAVADAHPDRYVPVGTLPVAHDGMLAEFRRCVEDLDMAGIQLFTNYEGVPLDDEVFHPLYEVAEAAGVPLWIHPTDHPGPPTLEEYGLNLTFGWEFETTVALARLVLSGLLERHPDLRVIGHHGAGMIPHFAERIETVYDQPEPRTFEYAHEPLSRPAKSYFRQFYADTVLYGSVQALETVYDWFGPDRLLFATDYPYGDPDGVGNLRDNVAGMERFELPEAARERVYGGTILELIEG